MYALQHTRRSPRGKRPLDALRRAMLGASLAACTASASAATITVNSLLDDVFPDAAGGIAVPLTTAKCTLRMAVASANLDLPVGGATLGCAASTTPATTFLIGGSDNLVFAPTLANGIIVLDATQAMDIGPNRNNSQSILYVTGPVTIEGSAATRITLDGGSLLATTSKRILAAAEVAPSVSDSRTGSSIWVNERNADHFSKLNPRSKFCDAVSRCGWAGRLLPNGTVRSRRDQRFARF